MIPRIQLTCSVFLVILRFNIFYFCYFFLFWGVLLKTENKVMRGFEFFLAMTLIRNDVLSLLIWGYF